MKKGKTWFSYILWLVATGFSVVFTYYTTSKLADFYRLYGADVLSCRIIYASIVILFTVAVFFLIRFLYGKLSVKLRVSFLGVRIPKWLRVILHLLIFTGITVILVRSRMYTFSSPDQDIEYGAVQEMYFNYMSEIPAQTDNFFQDYLEEKYSGLSLIPSAFENIYMGFFSCIYFFIGNQMMLYTWMPLYVPLIAYLLFIIIGFKMQKGFLGWIPAAIYSLSGIYAAATVDWGPSNFYFLLTLFGIMFILFLTKRKGKKDISAGLGCLWGLLICLFIFCAKYKVIFYHAPAFSIPKKLALSMTALNVELLIWAVILWMLCLSFWVTGNRAGSFYVMPAVAGAGLLIALVRYESDVVLFLLVFIGIWLILMTAEHIRGFEKSPQIKYEETDLPADPDNPADEEEPENESGLIRVSDIVKNDETQQLTNAEDMSANTTEHMIDRTAMIENVLPMPKKHVSRELDYSVEPDEDMMHYDVELENDDYDYK